MGRIKTNSDYPAEFVYDNILISANVIDAAYRARVKKLLFLGSSCIYPRDCNQPIKEEYLLSGKLEQTNDAYAIAKIAGIKICQAYNKQYGTNFIACMPTNLYGSYDNFDKNNSHVMAALIAKICQSKKNSFSMVTLWGSGEPYREFLHVDDLADACVFLMNHYDNDKIVNIGVGEDITISRLADLIKDIVGYEGEFVYDATKPDGTPRKLLDVGCLTSLGWKPNYTLRSGIENAVRWYQDNYL